MKIGLIVPGFGAHDTDWCIPALTNFARSLTAGATVHVFAVRWPERLATYRVGDVTVHAVGGRKRLGLKVATLWARALGAIAAEHRRGPFSVLHAWWADEPAWIAVVASRVLRAPVVVSLAGGELAGLRDIGYGLQLLRARPTLVRCVTRAADRVTVGSRYLMTLAEERLGRSMTNRFVEAPLGVDTAMFCPGRRSTVPPVLNVGALAPVKDQAAFLRVMAAVPHVRGEIVGDGPLAPTLRSLAASLNLEDRISFAGAVDHGSMPAVYQRAGILLQTSRHEAEGMAVLEAAACGIPAVGTAVGVLPEVGIATDVGHLAPVLSDLVRDTARHQLLGDEARARVERDFSLARCRDRFLNLYAALEA
ncbi:MAG: glycosyltransferase family 4 protein [Acidobacteria bacterium]|nr:glycosyltransferase family 4 protein [Acidobacteriota bacterium]